MFAIMGATGNVGGAAARSLLAAGHKVRAVLRDQAKAAAWEALGAEIAIAAVEDVGALAEAFSGTEGVFVMVPPNFAPDPDFTSARVAAANQTAALAAAKAPKVAALSSIGGERQSGLGLITQVHILEEALGTLQIPAVILRPGWFMENALWDVAPARQTGEMASFLEPLDKPFPMVATADIGRAAAEALAQTWSGTRVIEIEGPKRYTQIEIATLLGNALGGRVAAKSDLSCARPGLRGGSVQLESAGVAADRSGPHAGVPLAVQAASATILADRPLSHNAIRSGV